MNIIPKIGLNKTTKNQPFAKMKKFSSQYKKMIHYPN